MKEWFRWPYNLKQKRIFVPYEEVRYLETGILNGPGSVVEKFTMKNMYVQLINTYYTLEQTKEFLKDLPKEGKSA
jgi:intein-encoded DNA endonuclease-like protein